MACKEQSIDPPRCGDPSRNAKPLQDKDSVNMMATNTRFPTQLNHESLRTYNVALVVDKFLLLKYFRMACLCMNIF